MVRHVVLPSCVLSSCMNNLLNGYLGQPIAHRITSFMSESLADFEQTLAINPCSGAAWYDQGDKLANSGKYTEALSCFDRSLQLKPDDTAAWVFRGVVLIHLERYEEAVTSCNHAIELASGDREAWLFRGVALQRLGRYREAYVSYNRANHPEQSLLGLQQGVKQLWIKFTHWIEHDRHAPAK